MTDDITDPDNPVHTALAELWSSPDNSRALSSPYNLYKAARLLPSSSPAHNVKLHDVKLFLQSYAPYTIHKGRRTTFPRNPIIVSDPGGLVEVDILILLQYKNENDGYMGLLAFEDVFSRHIVGVPLLSRSAGQVNDGFMKFLNLNLYKTKKFYFDKEASFRTAKMRAEYERRGITYFFAPEPTHCPHLERWFREVRQKLARLMASNNSVRWIDWIGDLIGAHNNREHSATLQKPNDVLSDPEIQWEVWDRMTLEFKRKQTKLSSKSHPLLEVGTFVRIAKLARRFEKIESTGPWSREIYTIAWVTNSNQREIVPMYSLQDFKKNPLEGRFYREELQPIQYSEKNLFRIEEVLERRYKGRGKNRRLDKVLVKWYGWEEPDWIDGSSIVDVEGGTRGIN